MPVGVGACSGENEPAGERAEAKPPSSEPEIERVGLYASPVKRPALYVAKRILRRPTASIAIRPVNEPFHTGIRATEQVFVNAPAPRQSWAAPHRGPFLHGPVGLEARAVAGQSHVRSDGFHATGHFICVQ